MISLLLALIYICFISLGLPDSLLGSSWPSMYPSLEVPVSYAGIVAVLICAFTIVSTLLSDKLTKKFKVPTVVFVSVLLTSLAMIGFAYAKSFWVLLLLTLPYGLGAGCIDATLNNYVAVHYKASHMSWLHCMWGLGAMISPYIMGYALTFNGNYNDGYLIVGLIQLGIALTILLSFPLWKKQKVNNEVTNNEVIENITFKKVIKLPGIKAIAITFFCYCALEQTAMLWGSSYLNLKDNVNNETAAILASLFFIGITVGRAINGFLTYKFSDKFLIRSGMVIILIGIIVMFLPSKEVSTCISLVLIGLGCAPIYPSLVHTTPNLFGNNVSQAIIGIEMASAYIGVLIMPPLFGVIAEHITISLMPYYLLVFFVIMVITHEVLIKKTKKV